MVEVDHKSVSCDLESDRVNFSSSQRKNRQPVSYENSAPCEFGCAHLRKRICFGDHALGGALPVSDWRLPRPLYFADRVVFRPSWRGSGHPRVSVYVGANAANSDDCWHCGGYGDLCCDLELLVHESLLVNMVRSARSWLQSDHSSALC